MKNSDIPKKIIRTGSSFRDPYTYEIYDQKDFLCPGDPEYEKYAFTKTPKTDWVSILESTAVITGAVAAAAIGLSQILKCKEDC